jgi:methylated-DNA-[protein]-cysteine S-methyltransferase
MSTTTSTTITTTLASPIGPLTLSATDGFLTGTYLHEQRHAPTTTSQWSRDDAWFGDVVEQLDQYFAGRLRRFDLPIQMDGTDFQRRVWTQLQGIPYGETISYGELARRVGSPNAWRAVGSANGRNPVAVIVPCHRVIASDGSLGGYGGGLDRKSWLLDHEAAHR